MTTEVQELKLVWILTLYMKYLIFDHAYNIELGILVTKVRGHKNESKLFYIP